MAEQLPVPAAEARDYSRWGWVVGWEAEASETDRWEMDGGDWAPSVLDDDDDDDGWEMVYSFLLLLRSPFFLLPNLSRRVQREAPGGLPACLPLVVFLSTDAAAAAAVQYTMIQRSVFKPLDLHGRYPEQGRRWGSP
jgi:hypothetical protein